MDTKKGYNGQLKETRDGSHTLYIPEMDESYHSGNGAISESRYVFIESGLNQLSQNEKPLNILEVGLGTGLNALLTALEVEQRHWRTHYLALEPYPLSKKQIVQLNYADLLEWEKAQKEFEQIHQLPFGQWYEVNPFFQQKKLQQKLEKADLSGSWHLVYYDAFAPSRQPEMWENFLFQKISKQMPERSVFVTYSAKGQVRRDLMSCGFEVERISGPPGKREMLRAIKK